MQNGKAKGQYRCLTPQEVGSTVALFRKMLDWKQLTLALEAGVNERTIQRIEQGKKVDEETLHKIEKAFRLSGEGFVGPRYIPSEEELQSQIEQTKRDVMLIPAHSFSTVRDCESILSADGYFFIDRELPEEMAEQAAALHDLVDDLDIYRDSSHTERLQACQLVIAEVRKIEARGYRMMYGVYTTEDRFKVAVLLLLLCKDERFASLKHLVVPRRFTKLAIESLRG